MCGASYIGFVFAWSIGNKCLFDGGKLWLRLVGRGHVDLEGCVILLLA